MAEIYKTFMAEAKKLNPEGLAKARAKRAELEALRNDAERWRKLRDTPATHIPDGPMRQWLFARPGGADSMDCMVDEWSRA